MFILAGISLNGCVAAMTMIPFSPQRNKLKKSQKGAFDSELIKNICFLLFLMSMTLHVSQCMYVYQLATSRAVSKGISILQASFLPSIVSIASTVSRVSVSFIANMACTSHIGVFSGFVIGLALLNFASCFLASSFPLSAVCSVLQGICVGKFIKFILKI